ncbi:MULTISPECIES: DUF2652 domain-containing protein [Chryseobacterium]|jgi:hypothetical protein|uniref:DUF2652 domain-containing protein n=1 Tax=Chryseobacterium rhizosphaerae TaxID=395937 RepID=A0AAE3YBY3_9FLAO|nr:MULTISPECIES: DUF2652 domain-containing protein [Chryseobacterium]MBL3547209.1 DUF2652 domain-containing protein [Chryseobacterium sp. KMC2]MDC8099342.1 DUF2652 domain-containing protein [Chryseobacterium rhizosphaerae]MDR6528804.1 hypothetical protein [Chryseobacterium rhizosphaerae]MDR6546213.1 hypothetical protein [Chryseobacterium rhizosphaerae]REC76877.1 DUF2652 domain-containing protein [Chryseobacterium rhizosphaerae]
MKNTNIQEGIILIPDFSGFTEFVFNTKLYTGEYIVRQLLSTLIDVNGRYFEISEIEGDAILFYRYDENPSYQNISKILMKMRNAFNKKIEELSRSLSTTIALSLKFIVHYGTFSQYNIGSFRKLYGKTIVEAHQLLKNGLAEQPSYALFSNSFLENSNNQETDLNKDKLRLPEVGVIQYFENIN